MELIEILFFTVAPFVILFLLYDAWVDRTFTE